MAEIEVLGTGLVYRGSEGDEHFRNAYFPSVVELPGGEMVAAMDIGHRMDTVDVRSYCCRSIDGGLSWSPPQCIFEPDESAHRVRPTCRISRAPDDGQLIGIVSLSDRSRTDFGTTNPETDGMVDGELAIVRSDDGGRNWTGPQKFAPALDWKVFEICSVILPLAPDRWLLPTATFLNWDGQCPFGVKALVMISQDRGRTWTRSADVFNFWDDHITSWEQKQTKLSDGRLLAVCWCFNCATKEDLPNRYTFSDNDGASYGPALESPLHGQTCTVLALKDNHVLCIYRRLDQRGLWAHLAKIDGTHWNPVAEKPLWGTDVAALAEGKDSSLRNLHELRFGFPSVIRLDNGDVFFVFWGLEDDLTVIRWYRLSVTC